MISSAAGRGRGPANADAEGTADAGEGDAAAADFETARETEVAANQKNEASLKNHIAMGIEFLEKMTGLPSVAACSAVMGKSN